MVKLIRRLYKRGTWLYFKQSWFQSLLLVFLLISLSSCICFPCQHAHEDVDVYSWLVQPAWLVVKWGKGLPIQNHHCILWVLLAKWLCGHIGCPFCTLQVCGVWLQYVFRNGESHVDDRNGNWPDSSCPSVLHLPEADLSVSPCSLQLPSPHLLPPQQPHLPSRGIGVVGDLLRCPLAKRRRSIGETSRVEYGEYAKNLFHDCSQNNTTCSLRCWQHQEIWVLTLRGTALKVKQSRNTAANLCDDTAEMGTWWTCGTDKLYSCYPEPSLIQQFSILC